MINSTLSRTAGIVAFVLVLILVILSSLLRECRTPHEQSFVQTRTVTTRADSTQTIVTIHPRPLSLRGKPNRGNTIVAADSSSTYWQCLDSVGYFSSGDSLTHSPDTVTLCHNPATNELSAVIRLAPRHEQVLVRYEAKDSVITILEKEIGTREAWWREPTLIVGGVTIGIGLGFLLGSLIH